jgi:hypothetical protein
MFPLQMKTIDRLFPVPTTRALRTSATTAVRTLRVAVYLRISFDREGEEQGVSRQREDCEARAARARAGRSPASTSTTTGALRTGRASPVPPTPR